MTQLLWTKTHFSIPGQPKNCRGGGVHSVLINSGDLMEEFHHTLLLFSFSSP